ncbi:MAG TPA: SDR family oxidoreductase [Acidimicrobiia bacterium]|nr:SDR family oxidoreductase [Acidimicrobiia bacterium]
MNLQLEDKVVLITAASRGLGKACAQTFGGEGARVAIAARDEQALEAAAEEIEALGGKALPLRLDLTDPDSIEDVVAKVVAHWGGIDVLVANSPGPGAGPFIEISDSAWKSALDVNLMAMVRLARAASRTMIEGGGGRIVFIGTVGVLIVQPSMVLSDASRLALYGVTKSMALELAEHEILVNMVCPGPIATERMEDLIRHTMSAREITRAEAEAIWLAEVPLGRMGRPEDVGSVVALLSSPACSYITGAAIPIDGGKARGF